MSSESRTPWLPANLDMNSNDRQRTPKQQNHHTSKTIPKSKNRPFNSGGRDARPPSAKDDTVDLTTPPRKEPITDASKISGVQSGEGIADSPFMLSSDDESKSKSKAAPRPHPASSPSTPQSRFTPNSKRNTSLTEPPLTSQRSPEKTPSRTEKQPIKQISTNLARKSIPVQNPVGLLQRERESRASKEHNDRSSRVDDDDDEGNIIEGELILERGNKLLEVLRAKRTAEKRVGGNQPTPEIRQSQAPSLVQWPQCSACKDAGLVCDGENPCANCVDIIDCDNPTKLPPATSSVSLAIPSSAEKAKDSNLTNLQESNLDAEDDISDDESADGSVLGEILLELAFFEQQVLRAEKEMVEYQEYLVQRVLNQERTAAKRANGLVLKTQETSPFTKLKPQSTDSDRTFCLQIRDGPSGAAKNQAPAKPIESSVTTLVSDIKSLPRYKSIGRLGPLPLTRNVTIGKYNPYFPEDEVLDEDFRQSKYQEVRDRYKSYEMFSETIHPQRDCAELSAMWHPFVLDMIRSLQIDITSVAAFFDLENSVTNMNFPDIGLDDPGLAACLEAQSDTCRKCNLGSESPWDLQDLWNKGKRRLNTPARSYAIAGLLAYAFQKVTGFRLWHVIRGDTSLQKCLEDRVALHGEALQLASDSTLCLVCGLTTCPSHGAYKEGHDPNRKRVIINDPENALNVHQMVIRPRQTVNHKAAHVCGVWCVEGPEASGTTLRGLHTDGQVRGDFRGEMENSPSSFNAKSLCAGGACFWDVECRKTLLEDPDRPKTKTDLTADHQRAFENCLKLFLGNERGPCMAKDFMPGVSCVNIFFLMLNEIRAMQHQSVARPRPSLFTSDSQRARKLKGKRKAKQDTTNVEERPVFMPCNHDGSCHNNPSCTCFRNDVECEYTCGCDLECERRFKGCSCKSGLNKVCLEYSCECWMSSRECDPWLCGKCGVVEVLDQANKYKEEIRNGRCRNNRLQLGLPARTIKAPSEVQGYGLFAGEDIPFNGFIGEYRGEVTSRTESDRRGITYHLSGMEYLFNLNQDQEIDASSFGNKTRFMNNSSEEQNINVLGATLLCSGVQRVMLYAKRDIKAGEELLYDYAYPEHVREKFWERGQEPASKNAMIVAPGSKRTTGKGRRQKARNAYGHFQGRKKDVDDSNEETSEPPVRHKKRKRMDDDGEVAKFTDGAFDVSEALPFVDAIDDSDYDEIAEHSVAESEESEEGITESSSGEEAENTTPRGKTRRKAGPGDRRRGGEAQARAWETRKARLAMSGR